MPVSFRFVLNHKGVDELLKSPEMLSDLERRAEAIAAAAGEGMEVNVEVGQTRARASVFTATIDAMVAEAVHRDLTRAIDAGRAG